MDIKTQELIAIGAAYAGNCEACLLYHMRQAYETGASVEEVQRSIDIGRAVKGAAEERIEHLIERTFERKTEEVSG